jgi:circadian clock protein KaiC
VITAEAPSDYGQQTVLGVEDFDCDLVITLRNVVDGERRRRSIEVHKYRRSPHYKGEYPCAITARGMTVFPLDAPDRAVAKTTDRFSSGVEGLDRMNLGGWLRDSIVLVRGPTGSGKTTLAGMYVRAGAVRGERVIFYGFEEPKPILLRNFAGIALPMQELEAQGNLQIRCRYPEATSPEDLLIDLRVELEEFRPSLIVMDSISSLEHATSPSTFRHFMVGLASLLREHGRSALLTQTIAAHAEASQTAPYLSTVCDSIVMMDYTANDRDLARTMRVLKMRGSKHATEQHRVKLGPGGIEVEPLTRDENGNGNGAAAPSLLGTLRAVFRDVRQHTSNWSRAPIRSRVSEQRSPLGRQLVPPLARS